MRRDPRPSRGFEARQCLTLLSEATRKPLKPLLKKSPAGCKTPQKRPWRLQPPSLRRDPRPSGAFEARQCLTLLSEATRKPLKPLLKKSLAGCKTPQKRPWRLQPPSLRSDPKPSGAFEARQCLTLLSVATRKPLKPLLKKSPAGCKTPQKSRIAQRSEATERRTAQGSEALGSLRPGNA